MLIRLSRVERNLQNINSLVFSLENVLNSIQCRCKLIYLNLFTFFVNQFAPLQEVLSSVYILNQRKTFLWLISSC